VQFHVIPTDTAGLIQWCPLIVLSLFIAINRQGVDYLYELNKTWRINKCGESLRMMTTLTSTFSILFFTKSTRGKRLKYGQQPLMESPAGQNQHSGIRRHLNSKEITKESTGNSPSVPLNFNGQTFSF
jgi:hypothetical protein